MKILLIGGSGTIGKPTVGAMRAAGHEVVTAGRNSGDIRVNLRKAGAVKAMYEGLGMVDSVVNISGEAPFGTIEQVTDDHVDNMVESLRGVVDLVRFGIRHLSDGGCFVLTTGSTVLNPIAIAAVTTALGAGVNGFVRAVALSLPRKQRINCVLPPFVAETAKLAGVPGDYMPAAEVSPWYLEAIETTKTGQWRDETGWTDFATGQLGWDHDGFD